MAFQIQPKKSEKPDKLLKNPNLAKTWELSIFARFRSSSFNSKNEAP